MIKCRQARELGRRGLPFPPLAAGCCCAGRAASCCSSCARYLMPYVLWVEWSQSRLMQLGKVSLHLILAAAASPHCCNPKQQRQRRPRASPRACTVHKHAHVHFPSFNGPPVIESSGSKIQKSDQNHTVSPPESAFGPWPCYSLLLCICLQ